MKLRFEFDGRAGEWYTGSVLTPPADKTIVIELPFESYGSMPPLDEVLDTFAGFLRAVGFPVRPLVEEDEE